MRRHLTTTNLRVREADDGTFGLRGYAAVFEAPAHGEFVARTAFTKTLQERDDVRLLVNHGGVPLARTKSGTMELSVDDHGLLVDVPELDMDNPTVRELASAMNRGDIDQMSFAFRPIRETPVERDGETMWRIDEVELRDTSVVTFPWYETTEVGPRDLDDALVALRCGRALDDDQHRTIMRALARDGDDGTTVSIGDEMQQTTYSVDVARAYL